MSAKDDYIVKFGTEPNEFYLAEWDGDPARTRLPWHAKKFATHELAEKARQEVVNKYPSRKLTGCVVCNTLERNQQPSEATNE